jgi:hypothetical protein
VIGPWQREPGFRVATKSVAQIRVAALAVRDFLGVTEANIDAIDLLENKLRKIGVHFHIVDPDAIPGEAARAHPERGRLLLTSESYDRIYEGDPDFQLLVPHEIAHFALNHSATFARQTSNIAHTSMEDSEVQADRFSHEFAMPVSILKSTCKSLADIQRLFNVPESEARIRREQLSREAAISW